MTLDTSTEPAMDADTWNAAIASANTWRGQAIQCFAQAEAAVSETLLALITIQPQGSNIKLRRLVGQRFEDLQMALSSEGVFAVEGRHAHGALVDFRRLEPLRPALCHGVAKVSLERNGQWVLLLKVLAFTGKSHERQVVAFEQRDAEQALAALKRHGQKLGSALGSLRSSLRS